MVGGPFRQEFARFAANYTRRPRGSILRIAVGGLKVALESTTFSRSNSMTWRSQHLRVRASSPPQARLRHRRGRRVRRA